MNPAPGLLLLTESYPFLGGDDPFFLAEAQALSTRFNLTIVPTASSSGPRWDLPGSDCQPMYPVQRPGFLASWADVLRSCLSRRVWAEATRHGRAGWRPRALITVAVRDARGRHAERIVQAHLERLLESGSVVCYAWWATAESAGAARACGRFGVPFITRMHGYDLYDEQQPIGFQPFQEGLVKDATVLAPVSKAGAEYLIARYPWAQDKVVTLYLGSSQPESIAQGSQDGTFRVVSCSQVIPVKRVEMIMDVVSEVARRGHRRITWTHIGAGPGLAELQRVVAARPELSARVTFLGDIAHAEVLQFLSHQPADLFINMSTSEGLPVSLMEAASCGIPLLALDVGGVGEVVDSANGCLLPARATVAEAADAVVSLMACSDSATAMLRARSRQRWERSFDAEVNTTRAIELLVANAGASPAQERDA